MKILFCNKYNFPFSGTEAYLFETMNLLRSRGHEVRLFATGDSRSPADHASRPAPDFKSGGVLARARMAPRAIYSIEARRRIREVAKQFRPDVAHIRNIYHHLTPSILWELKAQGVPVLYHVNDFKLICPAYNLTSSSGAPCEQCKGGHYWNVVREDCYSGGRCASVVLAAEAYVHRWTGSYVKCVSRFLAPSNFVKQKLAEHGWPEGKIQVLPHFQSLPGRALPHPGRGAPILYFGRLSREKGVRDLIFAMRGLREMKLIVAGDGPERPELEELVRELGLPNVSFTGHVGGDALSRLISQAQFTIFPSRAYETFGKSILESFSFARPVIASDLGSRRELIEHGRTGLLYESGNVEQLAAAITLLQQRPAVSAEMGETAREIVRQKYSPEAHLAQLETVYQQLIAKSAPMRRGLRIAFIGGRGVASKYSGIETYYEETGRRLVEMGHQVTAYCRDYFTPKIENYQGIRTLRLPTIRSKHLDTFAHTLLSTFHACFSKYDIIHYQTLGPSLFSFLPRLFGKKTIVSVQGLDWQRKKWGWLARQVLKVGEWTSATAPDRTVVVSRALQEYYAARYDRAADCVPNGTIVRSRRRTAYLKGLGLVPDGYVLYLGRFSPEKNCDLLLRAFAGLKTPLKLVFAGGSSHTDSYAAELRSHQSERIRVLDWLSGDLLEEVLTNAALFVLPSDLEGASLALLDAMGAGICVLASDTPENCELIGDAGFTFRRGDATDLARMLTMLLSDERVRRTAGTAAQLRVREKYLWSKITEKINELYLDVACSRVRPKAVVGIAMDSRGTA